MKRNAQASAAFRAAFPVTIPILAGFWFLGITYGVLAASRGFGVALPVFMAASIFSGSVEFIAITMLLAPFHPLQAFIVALMVGARHLFYGISMLDRFHGMGWKKPLLIYWMCDETFSINYTARIPCGIDHGWFMLWVSLLDFCYWLTGVGMGCLLGSSLTLNLRGLDFVMTAMFVVIFMEQWLKDGERPQARVCHTTHLPALLGLFLSLACLSVFGPQNFIIPSMVCILLSLTLLRRHLS